VVGFLLFLSSHARSTVGLYAGVGLVSLHVLWLRVGVLCLLHQFVVAVCGHQFVVAVCGTACRGLCCFRCSLFRSSHAQKQDACAASPCTSW
jgi:hypothetical protein